MYGTAEYICLAKALRGSGTFRGLSMQQPPILAKDPLGHEACSMLKYFDATSRRFRIGLGMSRQ